MRGVAAQGALVALALAAGACTFDWPDASRGDELGPETSVPRGPLHRPGQPCTFCHGGTAPSAPVWALAGTTYLHAADMVGLGGVTVTITDAAGLVVTAMSNEAGNFWLTIGGDGDLEPGAARAPAELVFPLHVVVASGGSERRMRNVIGRERSCAACHADPSGAATVGRVFVEDPP